MIKKGSFAKAALCVFVAAIIALMTACGKKEEDGFRYSIPESTLPIAEAYALNQYGYDELSDVQTTVRADVMNVTERGLKRAEPQMLSDDFSLVYDASSKTLSAAYEKVTSIGQRKAATIHFNPNAYPSPKRASSADDYAADAVAAGMSAEAYYNYFKYMLMTQGQHLAIEAARRAAATASDKDGINADFAAWLKKHPSADAQYGAVLGTDNAVKKEITLDPIYRAYHPTGLYMPAGEPITVKVEGLKKGEKISIITGLQNSLAWRGGIPSDGAALLTQETGGINTVKFENNGSDAFFKQADVLTATGHFFECNKSADSAPFLQSQWKRQNARAPWVTAEITLTENKTYTIGTSFGGVVHIGMGNCYSRVKATITGAVETPHYILGVTTPEYFDEYLRDAPGVIAVLDTENGQLIGPTGEMGTSGYMRQVKKDEIDKLALLWHSFISVNESFTGGQYNRFNKIMFDWHVPAGAAVALGNYSFAQPTSWFSAAMNYRGLLANGTWGTLHEIGHNHASAYGSIWGFAGGQEGEVRNNALTLLSYISFCDVGTTVRNSHTPEHGEYANPYSTLTETLANRGKFADFSSCGYFQALGMYANIMHSFGASKYYELMYSYKADPSFIEKEGVQNAKRADFAYRCSRIYGMNFIKYFNDFYSAKISEDAFTDEQLAEMKALPNYEPISNFYAGGIDGVKTAGDYIVAFGGDITFDLLNTTISSLDTEQGKGFEILSVSDPEHGSIRAAEDGKWTYSFNTEYAGNFDSFSFDVKLSDGVIHTFTVTLRISYNGSKISSYKNIQGKGWDNIESEVAGRQPDEVFAAAASTVPAYRTATGTVEVRTSEFWWRAPESGEISLTAACDDWVRMYFGESFDSLELLGQFTHGINKYQDVNIKRTVQKGKYYAVKIFNVNTGGAGSASMAIRYGEDDAFAVFALQDAFHPDFPLGTEVSNYIFEPMYYISKKDNIKLSVTGTDKNEWTIVKAPENIVGSRYDRTEMIDEETGEKSILEIDKWSYLIDGQTGTVMHTTYGGNVPQITPQAPHEFIIDTAKVQTFNYFAVTTRNNINSYITDFELLISNSPDGEWTSVYSGDRSLYKGTTINVKFPEVSGRYLKLLVKGTSGGRFSVLAEIDAGIQSVTQRVIPSTSSKFYATKGWKNSSEMADEPNGYLISEKKKQKLVIRFKGESIALYAATGNGYGSADVYLDGEKQGGFDLNSELEESRKLVFNKESLENKEHTVEIITKTADKVMINVLGIPYTAELVNAPNIYKEKALGIALAVFVVLFVAVTAFLAVALFVPSFREKVFGGSKQREPKEKKTKIKRSKPETAAEKVIKAKQAEKAAAAAAEKHAEKPAATRPAPTAKQPVRTATKPAEKPASARPAPSEKPAARPAARPTTGARPTARPTAAGKDDKKK